MATEQTNIRGTQARGRAGEGTLERTQPRESSVAFFEPSQRWNPFGIMRRMMDDMDRIFETLGTGTIRGDIAGQMTRFAPLVDVYERDGKLLVHADLPGMKQADINIEVRDNALIISGERIDEQRQEKRGLIRAERIQGSFQRLIPLPRGIDANTIGANFADGVLTIEVPLPESSQSRRIEIKGGQMKGESKKD
jgi:HSP20 family protein